MAQRAKECLSLGEDDELPTSHDHVLSDTPEDILQDFRACEEFTKRVSIKYAFAINSLPEDSRDAVFSLYTILRIFDNIVDEQPEKSPHEVSIELESKIRNFYKWLGQGFSEDKYFKSAIYSINRFAIKQDYFDFFFDALKSDLTTREYQTYDQLERYMYGTSGIAGIILAHIWGSPEEKCLHASAKLGEAFALTNFLEDLQEDYDKRGRIYIPTEDYSQFGISKEDFAKGFDRSKFMALWELEKQRALKLYTEGEEVLVFVNPEIKLILGRVITFYKTLMDRPHVRFKND